MEEDDRVRAVQEEEEYRPQPWAKLSENKDVLKGREEGVTTLTEGTPPGHGGDRTLDPTNGMVDFLGIRPNSAFSFAIRKTLKRK
mmetsp:Transcript_27469/g.66704  ORF Transcript_27469/g.66704 Transcript_27469/m.66704 type:complete len:85 (-) Transcript_27469:247-501(-)